MTLKRIIFLHKYVRLPYIHVQYLIDTEKKILNNEYICPSKPFICDRDVSIEIYMYTYFSV